MPTSTHHYFKSAHAAADWLGGASEAGECAVDLEAASLHRYKDFICLVQVAINGDCALLDPLADREILSPLGQLLEDPALRKFFHGGDYDVRLLKRDANIRPVNLFDPALH